jgi:hypothetical protein
MVDIGVVCDLSQQTSIIGSQIPVPRTTYFKATSTNCKFEKPLYR